MAFRAELLVCGRSRPAQVVDEPVAGQHRDLLKCARFFEEVGGAGNDGELALTGHHGLGASIHPQHYVVTTAHDQQCRRDDFDQRRTGQIGPP